MSDNEKVAFFEKHISEILKEEGQLIGFIAEVISDRVAKERILNWPDRIKIKLVDRHINGLGNIQI